MLKDILREITPLTPNDCFTIFSRKKKEFNFPLHNHEEMEINLVLNAKGAQRIVGDSIEEIGDHELVFVGSNLPHGWFTHKCKSPTITEVTIQFDTDFLDERFLRKNQLHFIHMMFEDAKKGLLFSPATVKIIAPRILALAKRTGFDSILELFSIIHTLSTSKDRRILSDLSSVRETQNYNSRRIESAFEYMKSNFAEDIKLAEVAKVAHMSEVSFSRFIKKRTGFTFVDSLNAIRLGHVTRMLIDTTQSVAEIAHRCGFNNMANFNRTFKSKKDCTPKEFRESYTGNKVFI